MSPGSGVGRGNSAIARTAKPVRLEQRAIRRLRTERTRDRAPRRRGRGGWRSSISARRTVCTHPAPPNSATKRPPRLQRAMHRGDRGGRVRNPVQHRVAEHGVELALERQRLGAAAARVEAAGTRRADLRGAAVDRDHAAAGGHELSVSAPSPQPRSRTRSPGWGASSSKTPAPRSETKRAFRA